MTNNTSHFDPAVPSVVRNKILYILTEAKDDDLLTRLFGGESLGEAEIDDIEGVARDGYFPFQDGGYELNILMQSGAYSGHEPTKQYGTFLFKLRNDAEMAYKAENPNATEDDLRGEAFYDYQDDYLENTEPLARLAVYAKDSLVHVSLSLGYSDAPYYRDKYDEELGTFTLTFDELDAMTYETFKQRLTTIYEEYNVQDTENTPDVA